MKNNRMGTINNKNYYNLQEESRDKYYLCLLIVIFLLSISSRLLDDSLSVFLSE
ncbi:hypothetical protein [Clostridium sp.]|uniref:hypothetical protein n=1 Tax=Clostridium sp. TaxID=1506 RepID=UPI003D6D2BBB